MSRDGIDEKMAHNKISSQMSLDVKRDKADYVLDNMGTRDQLFQQAESLAKKLSPSWSYRLAYHTLRYSLLIVLPLFCLYKLLPL
jgi:hypothetical protein